MEVRAALGAGGGVGAPRADTGGGSCDSLSLSLSLSLPPSPAEVPVTTRGSGYVSGSCRRARQLRYPGTACVPKLPSLRQSHVTLLPA